MSNKSDGDYKWSDENEQDQILQIRKNIPQIIIEERKEQFIKDDSDIEKFETKSSTIKSSSGSTAQKLVNKTTYLQIPKIEKEETITKSDIQDIKHLLKDILYWLKEIEGFKKHPYDERSLEAIEKGRAHIYKYRNYYDVTNTIKITGHVNPNDFDSPVYNKERIFEDLERYADIVNVANDGTETLFVIISHGGRTNFSQEAPIFPGEVKTYYQVYELRLRSPEKGLKYRVTEYDLMSVSQSSTIPIEKAILHDADLPEEGEDWLEHDLIPTRFPTTFRVQVAVSIDGNFEAIIRREGNDQVVTFNVTSGPPLIANGLYDFELLVHKHDKINFRFSETGGTIKVLRVQEIDSAMA